MSTHEVKVRDVSGVIASVIAIAIGVMVLRAARDFDTLGAVFPRSVAVLMMVLGACYVVLALRKPGVSATRLQGSGMRRLALFGVMLGWALLLEPLGFLTTSLIGYVLGLLIANFDRWTPRMTMIYCGAGCSMVVGLFLLFRFALKVPLPPGILI